MAAAHSCAELQLAVESSQFQTYPPAAPKLKSTYATDGWYYQIVAAGSKMDNSLQNFIIKVLDNSIILCSNRVCTLHYAKKNSTNLSIHIIFVLFVYLLQLQKIT